MKKVNIILIIVLTIMTFSCKDQQRITETQKEQVMVDYLKESKKAFDDRMEWWRDSRFGMFIHWGPYSVLGGNYKGEETKKIGEWIMKNMQIPIADYEVYAKEFNPKDFDAKQWVSIMKNAGMKYVVITSKHHDGFALWDSKVSNYDMVDFSDYGKDILKSLSVACKEEGIKFGVYYSIMDWHHPYAQSKSYIANNNNDKDSLKLNPDFPIYVRDYLKPQLKELIDDYDPEIIWFDGEWIPDYTHEMGLDIYQYLRELKPNIIINNRVDKGRQGMQGMNSPDGQFIGDFGTPEQEILENSTEVDWESCMTMNDTWGFKTNDHNWKSTKSLVHNLIDVVAKGGNYLLNVGPQANGVIPEPSVERLEEIGRWLDVNGEAIYNTEKLKYHFKQGESVRYTKKKDSPSIYAVSLEKPKATIVLDYVQPTENSQIFMLGYNQPLNYQFSEKDGLVIYVTENALSSVGESYAYAFKIKGEERE